MKLTTAFTYILLALILSLAACAPGAILPRAAPEPGTWRIIPTGLELEPSSDGGQSVTIDVAFENGTDEFSLREFETEGSYVTAEGGATFPATGINGTRGSRYTTDSGRTAIGVAYALPPGFRARGERTVQAKYGWILMVPETYCQFQADIGDDVRLTKLTIPDYGEIDLEGEIVRPVFPGQAKGIPVYEVGEGAEVPSKAALTLTRATREALDLQGDFGEFEKVTVYFGYKNLMDKYDDTFTIHISLIGDDGYFQEVVADEFDLLPTSLLQADAGETMDFDMWRPVPPSTKGLKVIVTGDLNAVFDTGL